MNRKQLLMLTTLATCVTASAIGCGSVRVVLVPETTGVLRTGPDVRGHMYVKTGGRWVLSVNRLRLPEGWYVTDLNDSDDPLPISE